MSGVGVRVLGSGDAFGSGGRLQTCLCLEAGTDRCLIDCGATALSALKRWGPPPNTLPTILLTHLHGDHFGGLPFFLLDAQLVSRRSSPLVIAGPAGTADRVRAAQEVFFPGSGQMAWRYPVEYREWHDGQPARFEGLTVTPYPVVHASGAPAYALRIECGGKVIAYSGDTEWTDTLVTAAQGADLFICEAYTYDRRLKYHLDYATLMARRAELGCQRLILTHMSEDMLGRRDQLSEEHAQDGDWLWA
jgi:ribonuclease BN (tRNA processing enzyme)